LKLSAFLLVKDKRAFCLVGHRQICFTIFSSRFRYDNGYFKYHSQENNDTIDPMSGSILPNLTLDLHHQVFMVLNTKQNNFGLKIFSFEDAFWH